MKPEPEFKPSPELRAKNWALFAVLMALVAALFILSILRFGSHSVLD